MSVRGSDQNGGSWTGEDGGIPSPNIRRSPSGRIPQWAIDEALGKVEAPSQWRGPAPMPLRRKKFGVRSRRPPRSPGRSVRLKTVLGLALVVGLYFSPSLFDRFILPTVLPYLPGSPVPPPGYEAAEAPLGAPPVTTGSKAFVLQESPEPGQAFVAYDPCRPIHFVVRPENQVPGGDILIQQAVSAVSNASGFQFIYDGTTEEAPAEEREAFQPDRYGKRWAPMLIAWSTPEETPGLSGNIAGDGGSNYAHATGQPLVLVAGQVRLDAPDLAGIQASRPNGDEYVRAIVMHELGHVLGLDHVNDPTQLMHADNMGLLDFSDGDRAGLAILGNGPCVPQL
jgi:hypothetical protein